MIDSREVALAHDQMASEYDRLEDLWYPWLFARIHEFIVDQLPVSSGEKRAVDAGCGTGFQSFLLARAGYEVTGFDIASKLIEVACAKSARHAVAPLEAPPLFESSCSGPWLAASHDRIAHALESRRGGRLVQAPRFVVGDVTSFDYGQNAHVITCCGSVLSFVDAYADVLERMAGSLARGGLLVVEVEQRWNPDLFWPAVDRLLGGRLDYDQSWSEIWANISAPASRSVRVDYPFELQDAREVVLPIWLFSPAELEALFERVGLSVTGRIGIHQFTNAVPSTLLHRSPPSTVLRRIFEPLRRLDQTFCGTWPFWRLGCSVVYALKRR